MEYPSDADLDQLIRTRLQLLGIDLSVLPEEDSQAPADQARVMAAVRRLLRDQMPVVSDFPLDPISVPPVLYTSALPGRTHG